jgi:hypothetical protein
MNNLELIKYYENVIILIMKFTKSKINSELYVNIY